MGDDGRLEFSIRQRVCNFNSLGNLTISSSSIAGPASDVVELDSEDSDPKVG